MSPTPATPVEPDVTGAEQQVSRVAVRVVVVDGDAVVRDALPILLAGAGVEVVASVPRGDVAASVIGLYDPDVVLIGPDLPDIDGLGLVRQLIREGVHAPMVVYAPSEEEAILTEALRAGAAGLVARSRPLTQVAEALCSIAAGGMWLGEHRDGDEVSLLPPRRARARTGSLSAAELRVLELLANGASTDGIAAELHVSPHTVRTHMKNVLRKLGASTRAHAVAIACGEGVIRVL